MQSKTPLYVGSPGALLSAWSLVLITSNGLTISAAVEPAAQPDKNEHQKTAENVHVHEIQNKYQKDIHLINITNFKRNSQDPSGRFGPRLFNLANSGK